MCMLLYGSMLVLVVGGNLYCYFICFISTIYMVCIVQYIESLLL